MFVCRAIVAFLLAASVLTGAARAEPADLDALVQDLGAGGFAQKQKAIDGLAATGDPAAVRSLEAMLDGKLYRRLSDGRVAIGAPSGQVIRLSDPLTGADLGDAAPADVDRVTINNRLRAGLRAALGGLTLLSPEPSVRRSAADAILKARPEGIEPLLRQALTRESDDSVRAAMEQALAAVQLSSAPEPEIRIAALETLSQAANQDVRALVAGLLVKDANGVPAEPDAGVRAAAETTLAAIERRLAMWGILGNLFHGLSLGSVLLLAAVGLAITFGVMGVINMAHGEMVMLGAYTTFIVQEWFRAHAPGAFDYSILVAVPMAFVVAGAVGVAIEQSVIRFLYGRPLETLLATWGISLILQQAVRSAFGPTNREVGAPSWMSGAIEVAGGLTLTYNRLWIIVFSLVVLALLMLLNRATDFGLTMRAVVQNRRMAASMGIRTGRIDALTFGLGSGIAGIAGVALSQIDNVSPNLGQAYIIDSFMVVVFGGVGNLWGTLVGAMSLGLINKFLEPVAGAVLGKILVLVGIILFIQKRPRGLFALKGRAVEA
ncbi:MAG: urea ABC transporter permease subunit UrtB [Defluviicoccus sp.]|nr:urea ABC transporter permease subunit UrtB [Defluviicoccus sp.]